MIIGIRKTTHLQGMTFQGYKDYFPKTEGNYQTSFGKANFSTIYLRNN